MDLQKSFYGKTYLDYNDSNELEYGYRIDISYYKTTYSEELGVNKQYGIEIIKKEWNQNEMLNTESIEIKSITGEEEKADMILEIFKENKVTPVIANDVIDDIMKVY